MKIIIETSGVESKKLSLIDTFDYQSKRIQINKEINSQKVEIDRTVFRKSILEKKDLKEAKKDYLLTVNTTKYEEEAIKTRNYIAKKKIELAKLTAQISIEQSKGITEEILRQQFIDKWDGHTPLYGNMPVNLIKQVK